MRQFKEVLTFPFLCMSGKHFKIKQRGTKLDLKIFQAKEDFPKYLCIRAPRLIPCYFSNTIGTIRCQLFRICASKFLDFPILQGIPNFPIKLSQQFWKIDTFKVDDPAKPQRVKFDRHSFPLVSRQSLAVEYR